MKSQTYKSPNIEIILLDIEISLQMQSLPPDGPEETSLNYDFDSHFKAKIG